MRFIDDISQRIFNLSDKEVLKLIADDDLDILIGTIKVKLEERIKKYRINIIINSIDYENIEKYRFRCLPKLEGQPEYMWEMTYEGKNYEMRGHQSLDAAFKDAVIHSRILELEEDMNVT